jgi:hypothetical protein
MDDNNDHDHDHVNNGSGSPLDFVQETTVGRMNDLERLKSVLWEMLDNSVEHGDVIGTSKMSHQLHTNIRLASEIAGDLERHAVQQVNNLIIAPDYLKLRTALIGALRPYPEAAAAVLDVFRQAESESKNNKPDPGVEYQMVDPVPTLPTRGRRPRGTPIDIDLGEFDWTPPQLPTETDD